MIENVLSIAGSDPSGGAGIQADLKAFAALGCYGMAAVTALTAQNTQGVRSVHMVPPDFLEAQLEAVFEDIRVDAVKIGMAGTADSIRVIAGILRHYRPPHVVLDPVMVATSGDMLLDPAAREVLKTELIPLASILTPNIPEGAALLGRSAGMEETARGLLALGCPAVLLKGGHGTGTESVDILATAEGVHVLEAERLPVARAHGTGCTLSAALACFLAMGMDTRMAAERAKVYVTEALRHAGNLSVGQGAKPVWHNWNGMV